MVDQSFQVSRLKTAQLRVILFDLDGTLLDTDDQAVARIANRLRPFLGERAYPVSRLIVMKAESPGNFVITLLDLLGLDAALMALTDKLRRVRGAYPAHEFQLVPGVKEMLLSLRSGGYRLGVVTTRTRHHIHQFFERFPEIGDLFEVTCGLQDTRRLKPDPSPVRLAAARLGIPVEQCLMVGDTIADVKSARRAGAWSAAVLCGFGERDELENAGAHIILDSTADLVRLLYGDGQD